MTRKREDPEKVKARVKRYLESHSQLLITGLTNEEKQSFTDIKGLEALSYSKKLSKLIEFWNDQHKKSVEREAVKPIVKKVKVIAEVKKELMKPITKKAKVISKAKKPLVKDILIESSSELDLKFINFLNNFKQNNQTKSGLRRKGTVVREELYQKPDYKKSFVRICERLPGKISKIFKEMYLQGYFYISEEEMIEISQEKKLDLMIRLLFKRLEFMYKEEPIKEARSVLGIEEETIKQTKSLLEVKKEPIKEAKSVLGIKVNPK